MKKIISVITAALLTVCLCGCSDDSTENESIYQNFKSYISENGTEEDYYIQISKTADSANTLIEASRLGDDCAFMEYDVSGTIKFYRDNTFTEISPATLYLPEDKDAEWEDFEFEGLNEKYRDILNSLLDSDTVKTVEKEKTDNKEMPYKVSVQYDTEKLDTKSVFSNSGNFGIVSVKFETDKSFEKFSKVSVSCQYDFNGVIYLYSVTFGEPELPDDKGKNGQRPDDIEEIFKSYTEQITEKMEAMANTQ